MSVSAALSRAYTKSKSLDLNPSRGLVAEAVDTGVGMGASFLFGELHGRYREQAEFKGMPLNLLVGVLGKGAAVALEMYTGVPGGHHLNTVANAGLFSYAFARGVAHGTESAGHTTLVRPASSVLGAIPAAPRGTFLSADEVAHFSTRGK